MEISKLTQAERTLVRSNNGLSLYLKSLLKGREATPRSWLYEWKSPEAVLRMWLKHLDKLKNGNDFEQLVYNFDMKQKEKFGPQGEVPPLKEAIQVESFQEQYELTGSVGPNVVPTLDEIFPKLKGKSLRKRSFDHVVDDMRSRDTLVTNSGWPYFTKRDKVKDDSIIEAESGQAYTFPAIILFRQYNGKLRAVWMYSMAMNLLEYQITQPLQDVLTKVTEYTTPWLGFEYVKERFTKLWEQHPYAFGGDTTAMDAHMQRGQLETVALSCRPLFQYKGDYEQLHKTLLHVSDVDIIIGPNQIIRNQEHGIASGSGWTQLSETIYQMIMFYLYLKEHKIHGTVEDGMGIGDDYVWFFDEKPDSDDIVNFWLQYGLPGKPEKQSNEDDSCTFLQRLFVKGYYSRDDKTVLGGIYPTIRALNSLLNPEKWHHKGWNSDMFCARTFMILENTVDHPLFEEFVRFVVAGQKDLLPFAKKSMRELDRIQAKTRKLPGLNPSYNTEKRDKPLSSFASVKYARTL